MPSTIRGQGGRRDGGDHVGDWGMNFPDCRGRFVPMSLLEQTRPTFLKRFGDDRFGGVVAGG
eukprot:7070620-Alexandrium_andersonii.AAC.1